MAGIGCHEKVHDLVREFLPQPSRIADLAAGEGAFSQVLVGLGHTVYAVDATRDHWKVSDVTLNIHDLDSEFAETILNTDNVFDAITAIEIVEHLENPFRFVRECGKLLKPGGLLFLTTPNVEAVFSRVLFLYTGRLNSFSAYETVRPAHITPIFRWKLEMMLNEAGFEIEREEFIRRPRFADTSLKGRLAVWAARFVGPFVKGTKGGEGRIVVARRK